jgi:hypothetical protein
VTPRTIWHERQNRPSLVVDDLAEYAPPDVVYTSLLRRGVFKWLAVRRGLIKAKDIWKRRVTQSITAQHAAPSPTTRAYLRGYRRALEECRAEVRALCHSDRWQAPDIDRRARRWLEGR